MKKIPIKRDYLLYLMSEMASMMVDIKYPNNKVVMSNGDEMYHEEAQDFYNSISDDVEKLFEETFKILY